LPDPLPDGVQAIGEDSSGRVWLARLPRLLDEVSEQWQLRVGEAFADASASLTLRARRADGEQSVLKLQYPHREADQEADALAEWDGNGAVRLLDRDPDRHALLLELCEPGAPLFELGQESALDVLVELLPRLWRPAVRPFTSLADEAAHWAGTLPDLWERTGRPFERGLLNAALVAIGELAPSQGEQVLLH
jgi:streptomycin 6-kinase